METPEKKPEEEKEEDIKRLEEELLACEGLADFVLILADAPNGNGRAVFGTPADRNIATTDFSPVDMEAAADRIAQAIHDPFLAILKAKTRAAQVPALLFWRKKTPRAIVLVLEHSRETRHITSILLQRKIREQLQSWKQTRNAPFDMIWQETLGLEE